MRLANRCFYLRLYISRVEKKTKNGQTSPKTLSRRSLFVPWPYTHLSAKRNRELGSLGLAAALRAECVWYMRAQPYFSNFYLPGDSFPQVISLLGRFNPERRTIVELARETQSLSAVNCAFLVDVSGDPAQGRAIHRQHVCSYCRSEHRVDIISASFSENFSPWMPPALCVFFFILLSPVIIHDFNVVYMSHARWSPAIQNRRALGALEPAIARNL